jgi:hypothetical protein
MKATSIFEAAGFRVIHAEKDDVYILLPKDDEEKTKFGVPCLSGRAMAALDKEVDQLLLTAISASMDALKK